MDGLNRFDKYESILNHKPISLDNIFANQEKIFFRYIGKYPDRRIRVLSPFRKDSKPGCRFEYKDNIWWFVDNKTYNNKLFFNCIELVQNIFNLDFKSACKKIINDVKFDFVVINNQKESINQSIKIKFTYKKWNNNNYFTNKYKLPASYLLKQPYFDVTNYWCNTKDDPILKVNRFGFLKYKIAYHFFDTNKTKLYFPGNDDLKFYSNATPEDLFGYHRIDEYLFKSKDKSIWFTSSAKDEMNLNFHTGKNTLGLQSESTYKLPEYLLNSLRYFNDFYIWLDADITGFNYTEVLYMYLRNNFPNKNIYQVYHNQILGNDISDICENFNLNKILDYGIEII